MDTYIRFLAILIILFLISLWGVISLYPQIEVASSTPVQKIDVPDIYPKEVHIVKKGETLWEMANDYETTVACIKSVNGLSSNIIREGDKITIPKRVLYVTERNLDKQVSGIDRLLDAIFLAEGGYDSRVLYGATSFNDSGNTFSHRRNQRFFEILTEGCVKNSEEYYRASAAVTILYYWEMYQQDNEPVRGRLFNEISSDVQLSFINYLGQYYAPKSASPLNKYWVKNVVYHFTK